MICVYDIGNEAYTKNGDAVLSPASCIVRETAGASYELTMQHPIDTTGKWTHLVPLALIKVPVPVATIPNAFAGQEADVYEVTSSTAAVREKASEPVRITYAAWVSGYDGGHYEAGDRVTYSGQNFQCTQWDGGSGLINVPPSNAPDWWQTIPNYTTGGNVLITLEEGAEIYLVEDYNTNWYKISTKQGIVGYIKKSQVQFLRHETVEDVGSRTIEDQLFRIYNVSIDTKNKAVNVNARHVSYDLSAILIGDCEIALAAPSTAIVRMQEAYLMPYRGSIATNLTEDDNGTYTGTMTGKSATYGFLDPDKGMIPYFRAQLYRDNWDLFLMKNDVADRGIRLAYGSNLRGVTWTRKSDDLITRVVPVAKKTNGKELYLPETWIDSPNINNYPVIYMERLKVDGQIGKDDGTGTGTNWTEASLLQEMRTKAAERFSLDHADAITVSLTVDFVLLGDTAEYQQYKGLERLTMYDKVTVTDPQIGLDLQLQVSEIEWDAILERYRSIRLGDIFDYGGRTVAGYNIGDGAIYYEKLSQSTIDRIISEAQ